MPEPTDAERAAILAALEQERAEREPPKHLVDEE